MKNGLFSIHGKIALVTGATSGIGLMIARGFVEHGAHVYVVARNESACAQVAAELGDAGRCIALPADLSCAADRSRIADTVMRRHSRLDILVNNAGALSDEPIDTFSEESWDTVMDLNLKAAFFLTQKLLPALRSAASADAPARVINVGSIGGLRISGRENYSYVASKAGLHHLTRALARRLGAEHVNVNAIAPGPFPSKLTEGVPDAVKQAVCERIPCGRFGESDDVAGTAIYLASRAAAYVTGAVLPLDGGSVGAT